MKRERDEKQKKRVRRNSAEELESERQWGWLGLDPNDMLDDTDIDLNGFLMK